MPTPLLTRDQLLARLCETFRRYGYEGTSLTRIAQASGLGKASLYHHFPEGKEQMAAAVLGWVRQWFETNLFLPLESAHPPRQRLVSMLECLADYYHQGRLACWPAMVAMAEERDLFATQLRDFYGRWLSALARTLTDAGLARDIAQGRAMDGLQHIQGALMMSRALDDGQPFAAMAQSLPDHLLAGAGRSNLWTSRTPRLPITPPLSRVG